jgi:hypothetical protein
LQHRTNPLARRPYDIAELFLRHFDLSLRARYNFGLNMAASDLATRAVTWPPAPLI